mmetsp:Transcript_45364/g.93810  ORF Transcript_45364/g.93810 Transcript_45364/m.93810 type:complete len:220 (+) Transcript_45364:169-828(+)
MRRSTSTTRPERWRRPTAPSKKWSSSARAAREPRPSRRLWSTSRESAAVQGQQRPSQWRSRLRRLRPRTLQRPTSSRPRGRLRPPRALERAAKRGSGRKSRHDVRKPVRKAPKARSELRRFVRNWQPNVPRRTVRNCRPTAPRHRSRCRRTSGARTAVQTPRPRKSRPRRLQRRGRQPLMMRPRRRLQLRGRQPVMMRLRRRTMKPRMMPQPLPWTTSR